MTTAICCKGCGCDEDIIEVKLMTPYGVVDIGVKTMYSDLKLLPYGRFSHHVRPRVSKSILGQRGANCIEANPWSAKNAGPVGIAFKYC